MLPLPSSSFLRFFYNRCAHSIPKAPVCSFSTATIARPQTLILGASLSGLSTGLALARHNFPVDVALLDHQDQQTSHRPIFLHPNSVASLLSLGIPLKLSDLVQKVNMLKVSSPTSALGQYSFLPSAKQASQKISSHPIAHELLGNLDANRAEVPPLLINRHHLVQLLERELSSHLISINKKVAFGSLLVTEDSTQVLFRGPKQKKTYDLIISTQKTRLHNLFFAPKGFHVSYQNLPFLSFSAIVSVPPPSPGCLEEIWFPGVRISLIPLSGDRLCISAAVQSPFDPTAMRLGKVSVAMMIESLTPILSGTSSKWILDSLGETKDGFCEVDSNSSGVSQNVFVGLGEASHLVLTGEAALQVPHSLSSLENLEISHAVLLANSLLSVPKDKSLTEALYEYQEKYYAATSSTVRSCESHLCFGLSLKSLNAFQKLRFSVAGSSPALRFKIPAIFPQTAVLQNFQRK